MSFLQPIALLGIALAATPILIHLLNLMRHRKESWATMRFLFQAKKSSSRFSQIRKWLTLLSRVLAVLSLVLLMARPISTGGESFLNLSEQTPDIVMLILDRSSSMNQISSTSSKTLLQKGLVAFEEFAKTWPDSRLVVMETVFSETIALDNIETIYAKEMDEFLGPTDTGANLAYTINQGLSWLENAEIGQAQILVISDQQSSSWKIPENKPLLENINKNLEAQQGAWQMTFLKIEPTKAVNFSLTGKSLHQDGGLVYPTLSIKGNKKEQRKLRVDVNINGKISPAECDFTSPSTTWTPAISIANEPPTGWIAISLPEDSCTKDNYHFFTYGNNDLLRVGLLAANQPTKKILSVSSKLNPNKVFFKGELNGKDEEMLDHDLLFVQGKQTNEEAGKLLKFVEIGGTIVLFPDEVHENPNATLQNWQPLEISSENEHFSVTEWNKNGGIFSNTANGKALPFSYLKVWQRRNPSEGQPLAFYADGKTFLTRKTIGKGIVYSFSSLPAKNWSSLADGFVLVPVILRILEECRTNSKITEFECGGSESRTLRELQSLTGSQLENPITKAGVYQNLGRMVAFNRPQNESQTATTDKRDLKKVLTSSHAKWTQAETSGASLERAEIWNFFLLLMVIFLIAESLLGTPLRKSELSS